MSGTLAAKNAIGCIFRAQGVASRSPISGAIFPRPTASALLSVYFYYEHGKTVALSLELHLRWRRFHLCPDQSLFENCDEYGAPQDNPLSEKSFSRRGLTRDIASMDRELEGISLQKDS
jgi:hypothetical protein